MHSAARCFGSQRRSLPLVHRIVRDAVQADLAVRPRLRAGPVDAERDVLRFARRPHLEIALGAAGAAGIHPHQHIALGTHFSGSNSSQFWYLLLEPSSTSGADLTMRSHWRSCSPPAWRALWRRARSS